MLWMLLPFSPSVKIHGHHIVTGSPRFEGANIHRATLKNMGYLPVYYAGHSNIVINYSYSQSGNEGSEDRIGYSQDYVTWTKLQHGESATIEFPVHGDYERIQISTEVSDWRGRLAPIVSEDFFYYQRGG